MAIYDEENVVLGEIYALSPIVVGADGLGITTYSSSGIYKLFVAFQDSELIAEVYVHTLLACEIHWEKVIPWQRRYT